MIFFVVHQKLFDARENYERGGGFFFRAGARELQFLVFAHNGFNASGFGDFIGDVLHPIEIGTRQLTLELFDCRAGFFPSLNQAANCR